MLPAWRMAIFGAIAVGFVVLIICIIRRRKRRREDLVLRLHNARFESLSGKAEWYSCGDVEFSNVSTRPLSIGAVIVQVAAPGFQELDAKRILGDESGRQHATCHPLDIALRLPIIVDVGKCVVYYFHILFSAHIRKYWSIGELAFAVVSTNGVVAIIKDASVSSFRRPLLNYLPEPP